MSEPKFKVGDEVLVKGRIIEKIPTLVDCDQMYGIRFDDGAVISQSEGCLLYNFGKIKPVAPLCDFTINGQERKRRDFIDFVCNKLDGVKELFRRKNQQYSVGADPLANFRAGALLRAGNDSYAEMYEEAKNYRRKHVVHIERNGIAADKGDESLDDTIVYSAIMAYMRHCHEQEVAQNE